MGWQNENNIKIGSRDLLLDIGARNRFKKVDRSVESLKTNERCFIRKEHKCGKIFGASKSCFIACPTDKNLKPILELMSEKLARAKIEPIIAVEERAYGQDIFCTKICGKIIESQFCIVLLDDFIKDGEKIPNPNVYYEYGLMTSLRKHIVPLQNEAHELAFNIQSYDTIKYTPGNIGDELNRAIKDAIRITESKEIEEKSSIPEKTVLRRLELKGFESFEDEYGISPWLLVEAISDTNFKGFAHYAIKHTTIKMFGRYEDFYLYLGKIDSEEELEEYLDDLNVVLYRTENIIKEWNKKFKELNNEKSILQNELEQYIVDTYNERRKHEFDLENIEKQMRSLSKNLKLASKIVVGFIISHNVNINQFKEKVNDILNQYERYDIVFNNGEKIEIEGEIIPLTSNFN